MPDWVIHMGATHVLARGAGRWDPRWLLLGAVFPDVPARLLAIVIGTLPGLEPLRTVEMGMALGYLHTPFSIALLAAAVAVFAADRSGAAFGLGCGSALHLVMDSLQRSVGGGVLLLYPFDLRPVSWPLGWWEHPLTFSLIAGFAAYLVVLRLRGAVPRDPPLRPWTWKRGLLGAALLVTCGAVAWGSVSSGIAEDLGNSRLGVEPGALEGQPIDVGLARVEEVESEQVLLEIATEDFWADWADQPEVDVGDHVSFRATYRGGRIRDVEDAFVHRRGLKTIVSLLGAVLLLWFWAPSLLAWFAAWRGSGRAGRSGRGAESS